MIDLSEWEEFGEGGVGKTFFHKTDDSVILKLNNEGWPEEKALAEYNFSKKVEEMGIECPHTYDYVTDGTRFGMTVERIKGKKSFYRILSEDPSKADELARPLRRAYVPHWEGRSSALRGAHREILFRLRS